MITLKIQSKFVLTIIFALVATLFSCLQTAGAAASISPSELLIYKYRQIPLIISPIKKDDTNFDLLPQPGFDVTLLKNQTVHFAWWKDNSKDESSIETNKFIITDERGKEILNQKTGSASSLDIDLGKIKLKSGQKYSWLVSVAGKTHSFKFTVLDEQTERELLDELAKIDAKNLPPEERILEKAIYVQMLSEEYPDKFDLYWLGVQWLSKISPNDEKLKKEKYDLIKKYTDHNNKEMR